MAEIKSTLDLVMEKTRNLEFSEDEKKNLQIQEAQQAFNGLLQKYLDRYLDLEDLRSEVASLQEKHQITHSATLRKVILDKIDMAALNGPLPELLHKLFGDEISGLNDLFQRFRHDLTSRADQRNRQLKKDLKQLCISGSAVAPNLEADPKWQQELQAMETTYGQALDKEKAKLDS